MEPVSREKPDDAEGMEGRESVGVRPGCIVIKKNAACAGLDYDARIF